ncbi:MAG: DUF1616 domain-containing protein [Candidatus Hodarchaeota archaeon]
MIILSFDIFPIVLIRFLLSLLLILIIPGYFITLILYPKTDDLNSSTRFTVSLGISITITILLMYIANLFIVLNSVSITLVLSSFSTITIITSVIVNTKHEYRFSAVNEIYFMITKIPQKLRLFQLRRQEIVLLSSFFLSLILVAIFLLLPLQNQYRINFYLEDEMDGIHWLPNKIKVGFKHNVTYTIENKAPDSMFFLLSIKFNQTTFLLIYSPEILNGESWNDRVILTFLNDGFFYVNFTLIDLLDNRTLYLISSGVEVI